MKRSPIVTAIVIAVGVCSFAGCHSDAKQPQSQGAQSSLAFTRDSDGDGLSDYQERCKYLSNPSARSSAKTRVSDGDWNERKQFTYSITSVLRVLPPVRLSDMNDQYQDARLIRKDGDVYTIEVTYYPLNNNADAIGQNAQWRAEDAKMTEYLKPRPAANWDNEMRSKLLAELAKDGIDPDKLTDRALVEQVSQWLMRHTKHTDKFTAWYVYFPNGHPQVYAPLRAAFDARKPDATWSDQRMFGEEVLGKEMFYNKIHGDCTSTALLITTVMRALGIPTRIVVFIPPADGNDPKQVGLLLNGVHHKVTMSTIQQGIEGQLGFANHLYNEVFINHHWVRLNYTTLGQNIVDRNYLGMMTHVYTCLDLSDVPLARTWGMRFADFEEHPHAYPQLSSVNPYMLLSTNDQFGKHSHVTNPDPPELRTVTIDRVCWGGDAQKLAGPGVKIGVKSSDILAGIVEWIPDQDFRQLRLFSKRASRDFVLRAPGCADVHAQLVGNLNFDTPNDRSHDRMFRGFMIRISPDERSTMVSGANYKLVPVNNASKYQWTTSGGDCISADAAHSTPTE
jgi:hypothetical protein